LELHNRPGLKFGHAAIESNPAQFAQIMAPNIQVLIELRVPRSLGPLLSPIAGIIDVPSWRTDERCPIIPVGAATSRLQMSLDAAQQQLVLVRGKIDEDRIDELRKQPNVFDVHIDAEVAPFDFAAAGISRSNRFDGAASLLDSLCPIPPCDCNPEEHHGCLVDVATYLGANQIWQDGVTGDGIVIGIIDGGMTADRKLDRDTPGLVPRVVGGWPTANWGTISRWDGHANKMAINALGMAPHAEIYDIRISDSADCGGAMSDAIAGLQWAIEKHRRDGTPQILSCGWGIYQCSDDPRYATDASHPLTRKIVEAIDEGILVLFAAGNGGQTCPRSSCGEDVGPGKSIWGANGHPRVMTVGAANKDEQWIGYSSQGPAALDDFKPDFCGISHFSGYNSCDTGTSTACAVAAGVIALLKQARPTLTQETAKRILKTTAKDIGPPGWDRHSGAGIIQAKAAYNELVGNSPFNRADAARLDRLELENHYLKELFVELALERRIQLNGAATLD
jgi:subtilisin family serine protease